MVKEKVSFVPVSRENLERAQYPTEVLDALVRFPGTFATGFYEIQNATLLSEEQDAVKSFPPGADSSTFLYAKTEDALNILQHLTPGINCPDDYDYLLTAYVEADYCVSPMRLMTCIDAFELSFTRVWVEYDVDNNRFLVGYVGTALEDFRNRVYHPSNRLALPVVRYWVYKEKFSLSVESQENIVRTALALPGFNKSTDRFVEIPPSDTINVVKESLNGARLWVYDDVEALLFFYLSVYSNITRKNKRRIHMDYWTQTEVLSLFNQVTWDPFAQVSQDPNDVVISIIEMLNVISVSMGKKIPPGSRPSIYHYDARFLASCALYPVLASVDTVKERFHILDFFARGCETLAPGSLSYDDIVCAWEDNAIPWELPPTVGMQFVAGYARDLENTPTARMENFALGKEG